MADGLVWLTQQGADAFSDVAVDSEQQASGSGLDALSEVQQPAPRPFRARPNARAAAAQRAKRVTRASYFFWIDQT